jgi:5-methylcytosine-specific restriction endonuclease McrA
VVSRRKDECEEEWLARQRKSLRKARKEHPEIWRAYDAKCRAKLRLDVLSAYGGKCAVCGIKNPQYLTIDHIDNNGAEHKRTLFGAANTSQRLYAWLRRNEYPPGFQVLCWNHNASKQFSPELCEEPYEFEP